MVTFWIGSFDKSNLDFRKNISGWCSWIHQLSCPQILSWSVASVARKRSRNAAKGLCEAIWSLCEASWSLCEAAWSLCEGDLDLCVLVWVWSNYNEILCASPCDPSGCLCGFLSSKNSFGGHDFSKIANNGNFSDRSVWQVKSWFQKKYFRMVFMNTPTIMPANFIAIGCFCRKKSIHECS